ncbi:hypothetical protein J2128_000003 [Methanomicrobium sp. W14]|uniref:DUF357 domain-containing protein n=1 Tax=Methanomicrobium sp. W14 TaxID=2817839 RepID=UPI001AE3BCE7|nr:DUF357 domain-containing protein [Methanomicrobium sp. W14]MBP2132082.1 hypothetical protein [Methanomicrobium sp. W14]
MKPEDFGSLLESELKKSKIFPEKGTPFSRISEEILEMACAYRSDGFSFLKSGDPVNAHASFTYGFGWLDFGIISGLIKGEIPEKRLFCFEEKMPANIQEHLHEKTGRYNQMLKEALESVRPAPDTGCTMFPFSKDIISSAQKHLKSGEFYLSKQFFVNALAEFSYGYGILDAAVRCGLLVITGKRSLFTI